MENFTAGTWLALLMEMFGFIAVMCGHVIPGCLWMGFWTGIAWYTIHRKFSEE